MVSLVADIGGTKSRIAIAKKNELLFVKEISTGSLNVVKSINSLLTDAAAEGIEVTDACIGVAGKVKKDEVTLTNVPSLTISVKELFQQTKLQRIVLLNDVQASGFAINYVETQPGTYVLLTIGTGLGKTFITHNGKHFVAHPSEGGHERLAFSLEDKSLLTYLQQKHRHDYPQWEDIISSHGMKNTHFFFTKKKIPVEDIAHKQTLQIMSKYLGYYCKDIAVDVLPRKIFLAGGMAQNRSLLSKAFWDGFGEGDTTETQIEVLQEPYLGLKGAAFAVSVCKGTKRI
tara:strand:- start:153 stop:1013 length:861 start_codon:yes stop_codon:yes gene_type:complete